MTLFFQRSDKGIIINITAAGRENPCDLQPVAVYIMYFFDL